jgi:thiopurine S-methyltransferase
MEASFWHKKWASKEIAFHAASPNPLLTQYFNRLGLASGARVFIPLCGKTLDIGWLLQQGYCVVGAELSAIAIDELFAELGVTPQRFEFGSLVQYQAENIDMFVGDIFDLTPAILGAVDAIYDRAALVALPETLRPAYTKLLYTISNTAPQLLINYEYDQNEIAGPPFSISDVELHEYYQTIFQLKLLSSEPLVGGLKGQCPALEKVWLLQVR